MIPQINGMPLIPPTALHVRQSNFIKFVSLYFPTKITPPCISNEWSDTDCKSITTKLTKNSDGYKAFKRFSIEDYGAGIIREMVVNQRKYSTTKTFTISENAGLSAKGGYTFITLPKVFPNALFFSPFGQAIFDLAIIYHEFGHTMLFRNNTNPITLNDERMAVMNFENPVRIMDVRYEPRFTYYQRSSNTTINIITGNPKQGQWTVNKYDPSVLVELTHKDALL